MPKSLIMNNVTILKLSGSVDIVRSETLRQKVNTAIRRSSRHILIDFKDVTFIDSSGLSVIVMALKQSREAGIALSLCSINEQTRMLFQLTGMDKVFNVFDDQQAFEAATQQLCAV